MRRYPARPDDIEKAGVALGLELPRKLRELLLVSTGYEAASGVLIYDAEELVERNRTWEVQSVLPQHVAIGSNGGGFLFLMKAERRSARVYQAEVSSLDQLSLVHDDLGSWYDPGLPYDYDRGSEEDWPRLVDVVVCRQPGVG